MITDADLRSRIDDAIHNGVLLAFCDECGVHVPCQVNPDDLLDALTRQGLTIVRLDKKT